MPYDGELIKNDEVQYYFNSIFKKIIIVLQKQTVLVNDEILTWGAVMFQKYTIQFFTAMQLTYERTKSPSKQGEYLDIVSINTINRAAYETFLLFEYIYTLPKSKDERNFRFWLYQYYGYKDCLKISERGTTSYREFEDYIKITRKKIQSTNCFKILTNTERDKLLTIADWKPNWNDIAKEVKLSYLNSNTVYKMLSWYAHNSFAALRAVNQYYQSLEGYDIDATNGHLFTISALYVQSVQLIYVIKADLFTENEQGILNEFLQSSGKTYEDRLEDFKRINDHLR